jgi:hypothetical protein
MARVFVSTSSEQISYPHLSGLDGASQAAISVWIDPAATADSFAWFFGQQDSSNPSNGIGMLINAGNGPTSVLSFARNGATGPSQNYSSGTLSTGWCHVLLVYDGTEGTASDRLRLYVDGALATPASTSGTLPTTIGTTSSPFILGSAGGSQYWSGAQAGLYVWQGVVLDSTERGLLAGGDLGSAVHPSGLILSDGLWQGSTPTNLITSAAATVTGTTETTDPPLLDPQPSGGNRRRRLLLCGSR